MAGATETTGLKRFTVDEYHRMSDTGILSNADRVELVNGVIRQMSPRKRPHVIATSEIRQLFATALAGRAGVYEEKPLLLEGLDSEPEPDVTVCSNPDLRAFGTPATEPLLVIEVADSSLEYDLGVKSGLYAPGRIPEYWVVDLVHRVLVVFREPDEKSYGKRETHEPGARVTPVAWPDLEIRVESLFLPES